MKNETKETNKLKSLNLKQSKIFAGFTLLAMAIIITIAGLLTSCQKDVQPQQPLTVKVMTEGLIIKEMTKSFDLSQWVYNYNSKQYVLTFQGNEHTYTFTKSIAELQQGFNISVLPDNYTITYKSLHTTNLNFAPLDNELDIYINQTANIVNNSTITLNAKNDDFLIVIDNGCLDAWIWNSITSSNVNFIEGGGFKYGYMQDEGNVNITYKNSSGVNESRTIPNCLKGNVYHIISNVNGTTNINIENMTYNKIVW